MTSLPSEPSDDSVVPDIWQVRDKLDERIRAYRHVRNRGAGNAMTQAPACIAALQELRMELFGAILDP